MIDAARIDSARTALDDMDDFARMDTGINAIGARTYLETFIADVEKQIITPAELNFLNALRIHLTHTGESDQGDRLDHLVSRLRSVNGQ